LVPKAIVRKKLDFDPGNYFNQYVLEFLAEAEIAAGTSLVHLLRDKTPRVYKKDLKKKYGTGKAVAVEITKRHPQILDNYRSRKRDRFSAPLANEELGFGGQPDLAPLLAAVRGLDPGNADADAFHKAIERLLSALLSPELSFPQKEYRIHHGRKRIDIVYSNAAANGFFAWAARHFAAATIVVECKNVSADPANPELDQISGRFSPSRGQIGILVCRSFTDKDLFWERCRDTAKDGRGWVVPIDDSDLAYLVAAREEGPNSPALWAFFKNRFDQLSS
jgi:hypothetical protein